MADVNEFLAAIEPQLVQKLEAVDPDTSAIREWLVAEDAAGVTFSDVVDTDAPAHELLDAALSRGATAAAYLTYVPTSPERIEANLLVEGPLNSDLRWAYVSRSPSAPLSLSSWEYKL